MWFIRNCLEIRFCSNHFKNIYFLRWLCGLEWLYTTWYSSVLSDSSIVFLNSSQIKRWLLRTARSEKWQTWFTNTLDEVITFETSFHLICIISCTVFREPSKTSSIFKSWRVEVCTWLHFRLTWKQIIEAYWIDQSWAKLFN